MTLDLGLTRGQWSRAPVVFVLAQARFLPIPEASLEKARSALSLRLRDRFPLVVPNRPVSSQNFGALEAGASQTGVAEYDLRDDAGLEVIRIGEGGITFAVTAYSGAANFRHRWLEILDVLAEVGISEVTRLGLRYIDFIVPHEGEAPEDYVAAPWNLSGMPPLPGAVGAPDLTVSMLDLAYPHGRMRLQFMRGIGYPSLPADLHGMLQVPASRSAGNPNLCGVIDTDRWMEGAMPSDRASLDLRLAQMHADVSAAFQAMITPLALAQWNPKS